MFFTMKSAPNLCQMGRNNPAVSKQEMSPTENMIANREQKRQGTHFEPEMHLWPNSHEINPASQPHPELFESSQIQESLRGNGMTATCYARNAATGCHLDKLCRLTQRQSIKDHPNK